MAQTNEVLQNKLKVNYRYNDGDEIKVGSCLLHEIPEDHKSKITDMVLLLDGTYAKALGPYITKNIKGFANLQRLYFPHEYRLYINESSFEGCDKLKTFLTTAPKDISIKDNVASVNGVKRLGVQVSEANDAHLPEGLDVAELIRKGDMVTFAFTREEVGRGKSSSSTKGTSTGSAPKNGSSNLDKIIEILNEINNNITNEGNKIDINNVIEGLGKAVEITGSHGVSEATFVAQFDRLIASLEGLKSSSTNETDIKGIVQSEIEKTIKEILDREFERFTKEILKEIDTSIKNGQTPNITNEIFNIIGTNPDTVTTDKAGLDIINDTLNKILEVLGKINLENKDGVREIIVKVIGDFQNTPNIDDELIKHLTATIERNNTVINDNTEVLRLVNETLEGLDIPVDRLEEVTKTLETFVNEKLNLKMMTEDDFAKVIKDIRDIVSAKDLSTAGAIGTLRQDILERFKERYFTKDELKEYLETTLGTIATKAQIDALTEKLNKFMENNSLNKAEIEAIINGIPTKIAEGLKDGLTGVNGKIESLETVIGKVLADNELFKELLASKLEGEKQDREKLIKYLEEIKGSLEDLKTGQAGLKKGQEDMDKKIDKNHSEILELLKNNNNAFDFGKAMVNFFNNFNNQNNGQTFVNFPTGMNFGGMMPMMPMMMGMGGMMPMMMFMMFMQMMNGQGKGDKTDEDPGKKKDPQPDPDPKPDPKPIKVKLLRQRPIKDKVVKKTKERLKMLKEPKLPWYKRLGKFIVRHPFRSALIGMGAGAVLAFGAASILYGGPIHAVHMATYAAKHFLPTILTGAGIGAAAGLTGSVLSRISRKGRRERLYTKYLKKYKKCIKAKQKAMSYDMEIGATKDRIQELRGKQRGKGFLKSLGVYKVAKKFNRRKLRNLRQKQRKQEAKYAKKVEKTVSYKSRLNSLEAKGNKNMALGGYMKQRGKLEAQFGAGKIDAEEYADDREDLEEDFAEHPTHQGAHQSGLFDASEEYRTFDTETEELIEAIDEDKRSEALKSVYEAILERNSKEGSEEVEVPMLETYVEEVTVTEEQLKALQKGNLEEYKKFLAEKQAYDRLRATNPDLADQMDAGRTIKNPIEPPTK